MKFLFAASVGPVQGFIAAARKTRDLYAGSWILSEVAKAVALRLQQEAADLIFPAPGDLAPRSDFTSSNKVLAIVETESPRDLAAAAKRVTETRLRSLCADLREHPPDHDAAKLVEHVLETIEFYAAWAPYAEGADYRALYHEVEALLNARKITRTFPWHEGVPGRLKSSLDGKSESILSPPERREKSEKRVGEDEELDGTGFLKRFVEVAVRFESVTEIARLPFGDAGESGDDLYYAILKADGDGIGQAIAGMDLREQWSFSRRLSQFSRKIRDELTVPKLDCMPVFAGGDELIAMIPLHRLVEAAETLRSVFGATVCEGGRRFSMSAGIAIVHEKEPLDDARDMAESAKRTAKKMSGKNALCVIESPRSGAPAMVVGEWDWMLPLMRLVRDKYVAKELSYSFCHDLWEVLHRTPKELSETLLDLSLALAGHKSESKAAVELVTSNRDRLHELLGVMVVVRKIAKARKRWLQNHPEERL